MFGELSGARRRLGRLLLASLLGTTVLTVASPAPALAVEEQGQKWTAAALPLPPGAGVLDVTATDVDCFSATRCAAVGWWVDEAYEDHPYSWLYDGTSWTGHAVPVPAYVEVGITYQGDAAVLRDVECRSAQVCVAIGSYRAGSFARSGMAATLTGDHWATTTIARGQNERTHGYTALSCWSESACVAVGLLEQYDDTDGDGDTDGVVAATLASGTWTTESLPDPDGFLEPSGLDCPAIGTCTAVADNDVLTLAGGTWTVATVPYQGADQSGYLHMQYLQDVHCETADRCTAVAGINQSIVQSRVDGVWAVQTLLDPNGQDSGQSLNAISCAAAGDCTAVGRFYMGAASSEEIRAPGLAQTLVQGEWRPSAIPPLTPAESMEALGVSCQSTYSCVAVGTSDDYQDDRPRRPFVATSVATTRRAPENVAATPGLGSTTVTWQPPAGEDVTGYDVHVEGDYQEYDFFYSPFRRHVRVDASARTATLHGLRNGTSHRVTVRARYGYDTGPSAAVAVVPDGCPTTSFGDVPSGGFCPDIAWMVERSITTGTRQDDGSVMYKPTAAVSRQAMAAFLFRAAGHPEFTAPAEPTFADVSQDNQFYVQIEWMAARGISTGYDNPDGGKKLYKPLDPVSRQAMAPFLYRALQSPAFTPPAEPTFADVAVTHPFFKEIEFLAHRGISTGTPQAEGKPLYKPTDPVSRQAMAAFLHRAYGA